MLEQYSSLVLGRWLEPEKLPEWARTEPPPQRNKRYFGDNMTLGRPR